MVSYQENKTLIFVEKIIKRHLGNLCLFEIFLSTKTNDISGILEQHFSI
jgi:hypothetical protein